MPQKKRLQQLWHELEQRHLDGFLVPRSDKHQGEYVPPYAERLAWLTGFTGSAGIAIVHRHGSAIFVDGRYVLAVREQVDETLFKPHNIKDCPPEKWLSQQPAAKLGYDPWLHTPKGLATLQRACEKVGSQLKLIACDSNPIDAIWSDQPQPPQATVIPHPLQYAGKTSQAKREQISRQLAKDQIKAAILTAPDSIAWLLNIRGGDVPHTPLPLSFAIVYTNGQVDWFINPHQLEPGLREHLGKAVTIHNPNSLEKVLDELGQTHQSILVDHERSAAWILNRLTAAGAKIIKQADPCALPKACKNSVEQAGAKAAHHRDGIALTRFLHWLDTTSDNIDEIQAAERLAQFRKETDKLHDLSFETISAAGSHAAIVHYQVTPETNQILSPGSLYLVDSGGQYLDGTTDVTRTVAIGTPTAEQKDRFTRVLKGHIRLTTCRFPKDTTGIQLDILARHALWQVGLDFEHGTGHGVGSFLSVHEGPQNISKRLVNVALKPGMIISNEPGYYKKEAFGIRIENLLTVTEPKAIDGGELEMMSFETLTRAPIDLNLIEPSLLNQQEIAWLNNYHQTVYQEIGPELTEEARAWLAQATRSLSPSDAGYD